MFVPVSCTSCGKPFQVPEAALGKLAPCPWCSAVVTALPVSAPQPEPVSLGDASELTTVKDGVKTPELSCPSCHSMLRAPGAADGRRVRCPKCKTVFASPAPARPEPTPTAEPRPESVAEAPPPQPAPAPAPEPLSLDDPPPSAQKAVGMPVAMRTERPAPAPRAKFPVATILIGLTLTVVVMAATVFYLGYRSGRLPEAAWTEFTPPDGSFTVALPGRPTELPVAPAPEVSLTGGQGYEVHRWYARTTAWVAYSELDPALVQKLRSDRDRVITAGVLRVARDREIARLNGTVTKEAEVRLNAGWGVEVHLDTPEGPAVEWLVLMGEGPRPRLYMYGVRGKSIAPTGPAARRLFASFRVND